MHRALALLIVPLILLLAACGGGSSQPSAEEQPAATPEQPSTNGDTDLDGAAVDGNDSSGPLAGDLFSSFNPFGVLSGLGATPSLSGDVDPSLNDALLRAGDLPAGYLSLGDFSFSMNTEFGNVQLAANMFTSGGLDPGAFDAMVMSAAIAMPPEVREEIEAQGGFDELSEITDADLQEILEATEDFGLGFRDVRLLDAGDLGDGGLGVHMVMDFGGLIDAFGAPEDGMPFDTIAFDMYMFFEGDRMLMLFVMWPGDGSAPVDGRGLAETMDARAG